jgi:hypothetical protein
MPDNKCTGARHIKAYGNDCCDLLVYVWWQRREIVKRETVAGPSQTTFPIHAITTNFVQSAKGNSVSKEVVWSKPDRGEYKLILMHLFTLMGQARWVLSSETIEEKRWLVLLRL